MTATRSLLGVPVNANGWPHKTDSTPRTQPNLNSHAERWVRSVKGECLSKLTLFGEASLRRALTDFIDHYHGERNNQGKGNVLLFPHLALVAQCGTEVPTGGHSIHRFPAVASIAIGPVSEKPGITPGAAGRGGG